jgi:hypothetical protein
MTDEAYSHTTIFPAAFPGPWDAMTGWNSSMMSAVDCAQGYASACTGWQQEMARFLDMRLAENRRAWAALLSSRDLAGVMKVQQEWGLQAATDYTQEATRLARLVTTLSLTGTTPAVQSAATLIA